MAKEGLKKWFSRNQGTGWVDCNTGKPCGRRKGEKRKKYPACRPTMAQCNSAKRKKKGPARISWQKKSTGGIMSKKFGMGDGMQNSYEKHMESVIEKNMKKQNKLKLNGGGFIANGCGAVMKNRRKITTIS
tara:strand:+ start:237 stop:629 length:393 start_codon:yes stop_codon:yes gene_type:complete